MQFEYDQSSLQGFYFPIEILLNGIPLEPDDWVAAFNGSVCVGARKWDTSQCGNGICDIPVMGSDGSDYSIGYMNSGDVPTFKVFDASTQTVIDMHFYNYYPNSDDFSWSNSCQIMLDQLISKNTSYPYDTGLFENTATITSVFSDDIYQMGPNDILIGYTNDEIRSAETAIVNSPNGGGYIFYSPVYLNESINDVSFKYYNYQHQLIFNTNLLFSLNPDDSFGDSIYPVILNILSDSHEEYELGLDDDILMDDFHLINTYPNPFNPVINIDLDIKNNDYLDISIIDINGLEIKNIFNGYKVVGEYQYQWDASRFSSGIYFISIHNSKDSILKKICLIK